MNYYLICGERSGDLHASNLIKALSALDAHASFRGMGGDYCQQAGMDLHINYEEIALMGFIEVLLGFRKVMKYLNLIKKDLLNYRPDVLILVDFGGFNMKMAAIAKANGIRVHYYIPPKVWAWNQKRALKIKKNTDKVYSILPFEPAFFKKYAINVVYVGNPLLDEMRDFKPYPFFHQKNELGYDNTIALLPGSRKQEVNSMLKVMMDVVKDFPKYQFVIAGVSNLDHLVYAPAITAGIRIVFDQTYDLLRHSKAAVVASGTATLEVALFNVPQVVVYKTSQISYQIAKRLIKVPYISLVNLIVNKEVVKELIQNDFTREIVGAELQKIISNESYRSDMIDGYEGVKEILGRNSASETTAQLLVDSLELLEEIKKPQHS